MNDIIGPKRHHYCAQSYLTGFTNADGFICVFDRVKKEYRLQQPQDTALQSHFYTFRGRDGKRHTDVEAIFSEIEGNAVPLFKKIDAGKFLSQVEKEKLGIFISYQWVRVPEFEKLINESGEKITRESYKRMFYDEEMAQKIIDQYKSGLAIKDAGVTAKDMVDFIQSEKYAIKFPKEHYIRLMLQTGIEMYNYIMQMNWLFFQSPQSTAFVTSDNPVYLLPPPQYDSNNFYKSSYGWLTRGAKKMFPLTVKTALVIGDKGENIEFFSIDRPAVRKINVFTAVNSDRFLIARDLAHLKNIVKISGVDTWIKKERIKMY